jgi:adenosylmethionine-8-amino-7-oxononanoate aminotransferase
MARVDPLQSSVFHRELYKMYPSMVRGEGCRLWDSSGNEYLDASGGGAAVAVIGFGNKHVQEAAAAQMALLPFVHNAKFTNPQQERLAARVAQHAPVGLDRVFFVQGGAEANEAALRMIRKYHVDRGEPQRDIVVTQAAAYHGSTIGTLALSGRRSLQHPVEPWLPPFEHIPAFQCMRCPYGMHYESCNTECARVLDSMADRIGPDRIAAFMMETIPMSGAPALVPPPEFLPLVREWCDRLGALLVLDEVVAGMGRTGKWFATEHWNVTPDAITTAKGLGAGYTPIGALIAHNRVFDVINNGSREFEHGHSLNGNPVSCAIGNAVLDVIEEGDLVARSGKIGTTLKAALAQDLEDVDSVAEVRGLGTILGVEYTVGRETLEILDPRLNFGGRLTENALEEGLVVGGSNNNKEVNVGECTIVAPAFTMSDAEVEMTAERLGRAVRKTVRELFPHQGPATRPLSLGQPRAKAKYNGSNSTREAAGVNRRDGESEPGGALKSPERSITG